MDTGWSGMALGAHPSTEGVLAWFATGLGAPADDAVHHTIGAFSRCLPDVGDPGRQLRELGEHAGRAFRVRLPAAGGPGSYDDLRADVALRRLEGHALLLAALLVAVGRRRGYPVAVATARRHVLVVHQRQEPRLALSPGHESRVMPTAAFAAEPRVLSTADLALALLERVHDRAVTVGDHTMLRRLRTLRLALPQPAGLEGASA